MLRILTFTIFLITIGLFSAYSDSNGIWTYPRDITPGVFGEDESSNPSENYTFNNEIHFNQPGTFNHELITNSRFTANDVFYTTSNIGIGVVNPSNRLEVSGNIESNQFIDLDDNSYIINPNGVSNIYRVVADSYFSPGTNVYYLNPAGTSRVGVVNANTLQIGGVHTDSIYVNENQANSISSNMITNNQIQEVDLEVTNSPTNNYILSYDSSSGGFTWVVDQMGDSTPDTIADDNWIQETEIVQNTLDDSEIQDNSLTASSLAANSVTNSELASDSVRSGKILDGTIQERDLEVTNGPINNYALTYDSSSGGFTWVNPSTFSSGDSTPDTIADDNWIQETEIVQNTLDDSEIQDNSLTASSLAANSVTNSELASDSVRSGKILDGTIQERDLEVTNSPTNNHILSYDSGSGGFTWVADQTGDGIQIGDSFSSYQPSLSDARTICTSVLGSYARDLDRFTSQDITIFNGVVALKYVFQDNGCHFKSCTIGYDGSRYWAVTGSSSDGCRCFVSGTQVLMGDYSTKNIEEIIIGDIVMNENFEPTKVTKLHKPIIGPRGIFTINEKIESTGDHPFLTTEGWKVVNNEQFKITQNSDNPYESFLGVELEELKIGDILITQNGEEVIENITWSDERSQQEFVYSFSIENGTGYYADGYLVKDLK